MPSGRLSLVAMLFAASLSAQHFSTAARQQDLNYVANQVPKLHANFFFQLDPATVSGQVPVFIIAGNMTSNAVTISVR
jgi:hypothetical protein